MNEQSNAILEVRNLTIGFKSGDTLKRVVQNASFELRRGEMLALVGESGSGKSVTSLAVMGLLPQETAVLEAGEIRFCGEDLLAMTEEQRRELRGKRMSMVFQEPMTALNPVLTVGWQISEVLLVHEKMSRSEASARAVELLSQVGIPSARERYGCYPHELSGGMRQRVMLAMALACKPELLIADEPTTALDVTVQAQIMDLLNDLRRRFGTAVLFVTHNLALVREQADHVAVMVSGQLVEVARTAELFQMPCHPYTRMLLKCIPTAANRGRHLAGIGTGNGTHGDAVGGCAFAGRCPHCADICKAAVPPAIEIGEEHRVRCHHREAFAERAADDAPVAAGGDWGKEVLAVSDLRVWFPVHSGLFNRVRGYVKAVDGVDLALRAGETLALVGESGCGKTTVGKALVRLIEQTSGRVMLGDGVNLSELSQRQMRPYRRRIQMIFQDPFSSLDPRLMVGESLAEGMRALGVARSKKACEDRLRELVREMELPEDSLNRYPHQFSGGQRQRIGLARALSVMPELIVCDECTSALDVSVQAQILNLQKRLQREHGLAYLFITHDLSVVSYFAERVAVMYLGKIVERGDASDVFGAPRHPYTQALLAAAPRLDGDGVRRLHLSGDVPSPLNPPPGCPFHPRCPRCAERCRREVPPLQNAGNGHTYVCWDDMADGIARS